MYRLKSTGPITDPWEGHNYVTFNTSELTPFILTDITSFSYVIKYEGVFQGEIKLAMILQIHKKRTKPELAPISLL